MLIRAKLPRGIQANVTVKLAKSNSDAIAERYRKEINEALVSAAKTWRTQAKIDLSRPGVCQSGGENTTKFPGRCSGSLENNLRHRTMVYRRQSSVSAGYFRRFLPFTTKSGFDYADFLNNGDANVSKGSKPYHGYQERIYEALDKEVARIIRKYNSEGGRRGWLHT